MTLEGNFWLIVPHNPLETSINSCKEAKNYLVILDLDENMKFKFFFAIFGLGEAKQNPAPLQT